MNAKLSCRTYDVSHALMIAAMLFALVNWLDPWGLQDTQGLLRLPCNLRA